jgi:DNA invertase Pin-like site-specific DNA recombinase
VKADKVKQLRAAGVGPSEIARQLSISRTSVFRILTA